MLASIFISPPPVSLVLQEWSSPPRLNHEYATAEREFVQGALEPFLGFIRGLRYAALQVEGEQPSSGSDPLPPSYFGLS